VNHAVGAHRRCRHKLAAREIIVDAVEAIRGIYQKMGSPIPR